MADVAKKYGVSKATISWRVKQVQKRLGIEPSIYMRTEVTCQRLKQVANNRKK
jgi:transposase-like protein